MIGYIAALILVFVVAVIAVLALMMRHKGRKDGEPVKKKATDEEEGPHPMGPPPPLPPVPGKP
jgi:flagellar basal body-associated protein FliL